MNALRAGSKRIRTSTPRNSARRLNSVQKGRPRDLRIKDNDQALAGNCKLHSSIAHGRNIAGFRSMNRPRQPMGIVAAWKRDELSLLWSTDLVKEFGAEPLHFGYPVEVKWPPTRYWERPSDSGLAFSSPSDFDSRGVAGWSAPPGSDL